MQEGAGGTIQTVQNAALAAGMTTGVMDVINANATAISVICTVCFGLVYAFCVVWNAYTHHKKLQKTEENITQKLLTRIKDIELRERVERELNAKNR